MRLVWFFISVETFEFYDIFDTFVLNYQGNAWHNLEASISKDNDNYDEANWMKWEVLFLGHSNFSFASFS